MKPFVFQIFRIKRMSGTTLSDDGGAFLDTSWRAKDSFEVLVGQNHLKFSDGEKKGKEPFKISLSRVVLWTLNLSFLVKLTSSISELKDKKSDAWPRNKRCLTQNLHWYHLSSCDYTKNPWKETNVLFNATYVSDWWKWSSSKKFELWVPEPADRLNVWMKNQSTLIF